MSHKDAEVIIAGGCLLHDLGMSIHRIDHEAFSLFLAADLLDDLLAEVYEDPERTVIASEVLHAIIGHRKGGRPLTFEAGVVRVADALDMEHGRSRVNVETSLANIHSLIAAAIDEVRIVPGEQRAVRVEVQMNNSAGVFQVDSLLANKLRGSGLEPTSKWSPASTRSTRSACCASTRSSRTKAAIASSVAGSFSRWGTWATPSSHSSSAPGMRPAASSSTVRISSVSSRPTQQRRRHRDLAQARPRVGLSA